MDVVDTARAAFAIGWAATTAGHNVTMGERAHAGALAAMDLALTLHPDEVVEATLTLGELEGLWAVVYDRRGRLEAQNLQAMRDLLSDLLAAGDIDAGEIVDATMLIPRAEEATTAPGAGDLSGVVVGILNRLRVRLGDPWKRWRTVIHDALQAATAEGTTAGTALLADLGGQVAIDWDITFDDALAAIADLDSLWADTDTWAARQVTGFGNELGSRLAVAWRDGATRTDLTSIVTDYVTGDNAATDLLDQAIGSALTAGQLATYADAGIALVDFVTAGDQRVCPLCDEAEGGNSYNLGDLPSPPLHPSCRCTVVPIVDTGTDYSAAYADYAIGA